VDTIETEGAIRQTPAVLERRRRILAAAIFLFQRKGINGTTAEEIAAEAGVTKRTLYRHVGSKENLLLAIHEDFINRGLRGWQEIQAAGGSATERLRRLIVAHVNTVADELPSIRIFFEEMKHLSVENQARIIARRNEYEVILTDTLREGMETGEFRVSDLRITPLALLGSLTEIYRWYQPDGPLGRNELCEFMAKFVMEGLQDPSTSVSA
jgi:AcrR family transcriptional regulator